MIWAQPGQVASLISREGIGNNSCRIKVKHNFVKNILEKDIFPKLAKLKKTVLKGENFTAPVSRSKTALKQSDLSKPSKLGVFL